MISTDIKQVLELKRQGEKIIFLDCPMCRCFFGTNDPSDLTCSKNCNTKLNQKKEQLAAYRNALIDFKTQQKNDGNEIATHKKGSKAKRFIHIEFEGTNY